MRRTGLIGMVAVAASFASFAVAQSDSDGSDLALGEVQSLILTIDVDRLLAETWFGRRFSADLLARGEALATENRRIEAELTGEERSLTERRPTMDPDAFRTEADNFDARVQAIRAEQDAKQSALEQAVAEGRDTFLDAAKPALAELMIDRGATIILERRDVFLSASIIDITVEAITAIDARLGEDSPIADPVAPAPDDEAAPDGG